MPLITQRLKDKEAKVQWLTLIVCTFFSSFTIPVFFVSGLSGALDFIGPFVTWFYLLSIEAFVERHFVIDCSILSAVI